MLLGNGDGTFQDQIPSPGLDNPLGITSADFNGDGNLDVATNTLIGPGAIQVLLGNGDGTFQEPQDYEIVGTFGYLTSADFNGDGKPDLAVTSVSGGELVLLSVLMNKGDGTFQEPQQTYGPFGIAFGVDLTSADFNGDGNLDVALASTAGVYVLLGNGDGTFGEPKQYGPGSDLFTITSADFDHKNGPDLAVARSDTLTEWTGEVVVLLNNGDGTFAPAASYSTGGWTQGITNADFDGDGNLDLAVTNVEDPGPSENPNVVSVLINNGEGAFSLQEQNYLILPQDAEDHVCCLTSADFNGDGMPDVAASNYSTTEPIVAVLINDTAGFGEQPPLPGEGGSGSKERVLVSHKGKKELCLPEAALNAHLNHGDEIIDEEGCSDTEHGGRRGLR